MRSWNVRKAIRRSGGKKNILGKSNKLPSQKKPESYISAIPEHALCIDHLEESIIFIWKNHTYAIAHELGLTELFELSKFGLKLLICACGTLKRMNQLSRIKYRHNRSMLSEFLKVSQSYVKAKP